MDPELRGYILHFLKKSGQSPLDVEFLPIPADGSKRLFWRITLSTPGPSFIAMANPGTDSVSKRENFAHIMIGRHLHRRGIPVPEIHSYDLEHGWSIMEDMGHMSLQDFVSVTENPMPIYEKVLEHLLRLQTDGVQGFDTNWCSQTERYDLTVMRRYEADYFRDAFLYRYLGLKKVWPELEAPFNFVSETASRADTCFFLHRDFQSRNIIISGDKIGIIDWQGGRLGPLGYDLASLIIDPYTQLSPHQRDELYHRYLLLIREYNAEWIESLTRYLPYLAIQRNLQILGAFSFLTQTGNKRYFEAYIPGALRTLHDLLHQVNDPQLSPLRNLVNELQPIQKTLDRHNFGV
jgi:aminoglycoside/choline kinase family phosphotransferase